MLFNSIDMNSSSAFRKLIRPFGNVPVSTGALALFAYSQMALAIGAPGLPNSATPGDYASHYNIPSQYTGQGQSVVVLTSTLSFREKYDQNLGIQHDLSVYTSTMGLTVCAAGSTCYELADLIPDPTQVLTSNDAAARTSIEMIRAIAPQAHIYLLDMGTDQAGAAAKIRAIAPVAVVMNWSRPEFAGQLSADVNCLCDGFFRAHPEIAFIAANNPVVPAYPATSPYVTSVGATNWVPSTNGDWPYTTGYAISALEKIAGNQATYMIQQGYRLPSWFDSNTPPMQADIALNGTYPVSTYELSQLKTEVGVQTAAPAWAGIVALMGDAFARNGKSLPALLASSNGMRNLLYSSSWAATFNHLDPAAVITPEDGLGAPNAAGLIAAALKTAARAPAYGGYGSGGSNGYKSFDGGWIQSQTAPAHISGYDDFFFACNSTWACSLNTAGTDLAATLSLPGGNGTSGGAVAHLRYEYAVANGDFRWIIQQDTPIAPAPSFGGYGASGKNGYQSFNGGWIQTQAAPSHISGYDDFFFNCGSTWSCTVSAAGTDAPADINVLAGNGNAGSGGLVYLHWGYSAVTRDYRWRVVAR
jgi:hypothetical protein